MLTSLPRAVSPPQGGDGSESDPVRPTAADTVIHENLGLAAGKERHRRAWLSTLTTSGFGYLMTLISFVAVPLYLKWLGVESYGRFLTLLAFMGYLNFADAGLNWGALVLIGQAHGRQDKIAVASLFRHAAVLAFFSALLALMAAWGVGLLSSAGYRLPMFAQGPAPGRSLLLIGFKSAFMLSTSCVMAMAYGLQEGFWFARLQGYFQVLGASLMLGAAFWFRSVDAVVAASTFASALACIVTLALAARRYAEYLQIKTPFSRDSFRTQLRVGGKSFVLQGSRLVRSTAPLFLVASFAGSNAVPTLTLPMTLLGVVSGFLFNWSASLQTAYGESWAKGDKRWIAATIRVVVERGLGWLLLASCLILSLGQSFVQIWTSGHITVPATMLVSAVALVAASWITDVMVFALVGINRQGRIALIELLNVGVSTGIGWLFCIAGHADFVGVVVLVTSLATTAWVGRRQLIFWLETKQFQPGGTTLFRFAVAAGCTAGVLWLLPLLWVAPLGTEAAWFKMATIGVIGVTVFFASMRVGGVKSELWPGFDSVALIKSRISVITRAVR